LKFLILGNKFSYINAIIVAPDISRMVFGSVFTLKVWDLTTGKLLSSINLDAPINYCAVASDNKTIVAGDAGGMVHFLRLEM